MAQGLEGGVILRFEGGFNVHGSAPVAAEFLAQHGLVIVTHLNGLANTLGFDSCEKGKVNAPAPLYSRGLNRRREEPKNMKQSESTGH